MPLFRLNRDKTAATRNTPKVLAYLGAAFLAAQWPLAQTGRERLPAPLFGLQLDRDAAIPGAPENPFLAPLARVKRLHLQARATQKILVLPAARDSQVELFPETLLHSFSCEIKRALPLLSGFLKARA